MSVDRAELEALDRESLVVRAQEAGIRRARILTRPELIDELLRNDPSADASELKKTRGFFGRARDLVARVVERGLHLPDAAERIREMGTLPASVPRAEPQAMPTVTLAEIYAAQGHPKRALDTVRKVLEREPDHAAARALLARLEDAGYVAPEPVLPPEPEHEPEPVDDDDDDADVAEADAEDADADADVADDAAPLVAALGDALGQVFGEALEALGEAATANVEVVSFVPVTMPASSIAESITPPATNAACECFAVPMGAGRMFVRWHLPNVSSARTLVVRAFLVTPSWDGPTTETRDEAIDNAFGDIVLRRIPAGTIVRVAVGTLDDGEFTPLAHSPAIESASGRGLVLWSVAGVRPLVLDDPSSVPLANAVAAARRAAVA